MTITQRKTIINRGAFMSDHQRQKQESETAAEICFLALCAIVILGAILKACGVLA